MPFVVLLIGALLIVTAFNNSFGTLATQLEGDIPGFFKWAAAIAAILGLGYIPGFRTPSRYLLALVLMVILLANYSQIIAGFQSFLTSGGTASGGAGQANPSAAYTANPATTTTPTTTQISGGAGTTTSATTSATTTAASATQTLTAAQALAANPLNPNAYVGLAAGFGGLA
jgi:type III secretory pathway component EscV